MVVNMVVFVCWLIGLCCLVGFCRYCFWGNMDVVLYYVELVGDECWIG